MRALDTSVAVPAAAAGSVLLTRDARAATTYGALGIRYERLP